MAPFFGGGDDVVVDVTVDEQADDRLRRGCRGQRASQRFPAETA